MLKVIGGAESGEFKAVASGTLPNGKPVVVNADGTVSVIAETGITEGAGSNATFESATSTWMASAYDSNAKRIVIAYSDGGNSSAGTAVVCAVDGKSLTFGTPVVFSSDEVNHIDVTFDSSNNKIVIAWHNYNSGTDTGKAIVGTVDSSGNSISFGSATNFESGNNDSIGCGFDSTNNKVVIAYKDHSNSNRGTAIVGTVSGTSISFGSAVVYETGAAARNIVMFDSSNDKIVIVYSDQADGDDGKAIVGTVSGDSISFGSFTKFETGGVFGNWMGAAFDSTNNKIVIAYADTNNSAYGTGIVGTVSGDSISFGTPTVFESANSNYIRVAFNALAGKVIIVYQDKGNTDIGTYVEGTVSGTSISFDTPTTFPSNAAAIYTSVAYDSDQYASVISFANTNNSLYGTSFSYQSTGTATNLTAENYIGMSSGPAVDTGNATVDIIGAVADVPATPYVIAGASYDNKSFSVNAQETAPSGISFKTDGTKMYVIGTGSDTVFQYSLSTAWDVSTSSYDSVSFSVASQETAPQELFIKPDGTKLYVVGSVNDTVYQYSLSTAWDVSTASYDSVSFSVASQDTTPVGLFFKSDGTKMYVSGNVNDGIFQYSLSTAWNVSTASYDSVSLDVSSQVSTPNQSVFSDDGTKVFVADGAIPYSIYQYNLTTAWDLSSGSYANVSFDLSSQGESPRALFFSSDGTKMYTAGTTNDTVYQYSTESTLTAGEKYYVQTDGTLSTTAGSPSVLAGTAIASNKLLVKT